MDSNLTQQKNQLRLFQEWPIQNDLLGTLYERLERGVIPHTMLFVGESSETAKLTGYLAQLLLCEGPNAPCGQCQSCVQFAAGNHPDYAMVGDGEGSSVKTGQVEQLQKQLMLRAHGGGRLVYVVRGIDTATPVAANRLLKTLEEPSSSVIALLTAASLARVLPTIVSRSFIFRLSETGHVLDWDDPFHLPEIPHDAQENGGFATFFRPVLQWTRDLFFGREPVLVLAASFIQVTSDMELDLALQMLSLWLRDILHHGLGDLSHIRFREFESELNQFSHHKSPQELSQMIQIVLDARTRLRAHVAPALNIEQMCIRLQEVK